MWIDEGSNVYFTLCWLECTIVLLSIMMSALATVKDEIGLLLYSQPASQPASRETF